MLQFIRSSNFYWFLRIFHMLDHILCKQKRFALLFQSVSCLCLPFPLPFSLSLSLSPSQSPSHSLWFTALCRIMVGFPGGSDSKESGRIRKIPFRREWLPSPIFFHGEFHGQRSLVGYSPWGRKESDMTEWLTLSLSQEIITITSYKME